MNMLKFRPQWARAVALAGMLAVSASGVASAQVRSVDPDAAIDGDLTAGQDTPASPSAYPPSQPAPTYPASNGASGESAPLPPVRQSTEPSSRVDNWNPQSIGLENEAQQGNTYRKDDLIGAAEGVFGKGAQGLASMIEDLLKKQGEPNAYIVGREGSGAIGIGLRYGSGTLHHKVEGTRPVYWTGPSIGFDAGLNAANAFVLVYNLYDSEELFKRFPAGEGQAYLVGGFHVSYMRRGDVVLIPVRMGAGVRLGVNAGYMKFSHEQNWLPF